MAKFAELPLLEPVADELLELLELQPAASAMLPTAATVATIDLVARKVVPPSRPRD